MDLEKDNIIDSPGAEVVEDSAEPMGTADLITMAQITVTQLPIIEERLRDVKAAVEAAVSDAKSLVATADTIQAVKARRAELNKQFDTLDAQRKAVKEKVLAPYSQFEAVYKECIATPFKEADAALKATVDGFEGELKREALEKLKAFYEELCASEQIDWLPFEKALRLSGVKISLADTRTRKPNKAIDAMAVFISKVAIGMEQIRKMEDSAEILVEYQKTLDVGAAVAAIQDRKRQIKEAAEAEEQRKADEAKRQEMLAQVEAMRPVAVAPPEPITKPEQQADYPASFAFTIFFKNAEEWQKVRPLLKQLKNLLVQEGIQYGK